MSETDTEPQTAICQCGAEIQFIDEVWMHVRIEDGSHNPEPLTNQPPPPGHPNFGYLQQRYLDELEAKLHEKQGKVDDQVAAYDDHVRQLEVPGYVPPAADDDTLPEWLYHRFRPSAAPWAALDEDDRKFWEHEAAAVRRAVVRNGFKDYDPERSKVL